MNNLVIDTDIFIDLLRGYEKAKRFFEEVKNEDILYFSAVTEIELVSGQDCRKLDKRAEVIGILSNFLEIPVDNKIALTAGDFRRVYGVAFADAAIAATAYILKANLITRNKKDFEKIREIKVRVPY